MASAGSSFGGGAPTSLTSSVPTAASCSVRSSVRSQFSDGRLRFGCDHRRHALGVCAIELSTNRAQLAVLEFSDGDPS